jgi:hypothetical protein
MYNKPSPIQINIIMQLLRIKQKRIHQRNRLHDRHDC